MKTRPRGTVVALVRQAVETGSNYTPPTRAEQARSRRRASLAREIAAAAAPGVSRAISPRLRAPRLAARGSSSPTIIPEPVEPAAPSLGDQLIAALRDLGQAIRSQPAPTIILQPNPGEVRVTEVTERDNLGRFLRSVTTTQPLPPGAALVEVEAATESNV